MPIQSVVDNLDTVPEALRGEYKEVDGKYHLTVEGLVPKSRLDEFRNTNITTRKELDTLKAQYDGVDVETYKTLTEQAAKIKEKKLIEAGKVDELLAERTGVMKAAHDRELANVTATATAATKRLESLLVDGALKDQGIKDGVRPEGLRDYVSRGREVFRLHEGVAAAFDGDKPSYGKDGAPLSMAEWSAGVAAEASYMFVSSTGGGARGAGGGNTPSGAIDRNDNKSFLDNVANIASGKVKVA